MVHPEISRSAASNQREVLLPVYPLTEGLRQTELRKWQEEAISCMDEITEYLPEEIVTRNRLCDLPYAIQNIHFPEDLQKLRVAKFRLIFDELLQLQMGLLSLKERFSGNQKGISFSKKVNIDTFVKTLPFPMTGAQNKVLAEIMKDMESDHVMNRLIQGDVGSGKTVIAAAAAYKAIKSGFQAVIMAPTELLAAQHLTTLTELFDPLGIRVGCLTGSLPQNEKKTDIGVCAKGRNRFFGRNACADTAQRIFPGSWTRHNGRTASIRGETKGAFAAKRQESGYSCNDGDADPAHTCGDIVRRS